MASRYRSPSFSAPPTLERQTKRSNWFSNAKNAIMRPWQRKSQRKPKKSRHHPQESSQGPSLTSFDGYMSNFQQQAFPNFGDRLSPLGGRPQSRGKAGTDYVDSPREETNNIKIPESLGPSRPALSNIFSMQDNTPKVAPQQTSSAKETVPTDSRRHSTPIIPVQQLPSRFGDRRESASSDTSVDKLRQSRRERRASATRELPLLPKRGDDPFHTPSPAASPQHISPYSEPGDVTPTLKPSGIDYSRPDQITMNFGPASRPPVAPGGASNSFAYPPTWLQPYQQLQELEEELEEDGEGDGQEDETIRIEETARGFKPASDLGPTFASIPPSNPKNFPPGPKDSAPANKSAFGKLMGIMSSSSSRQRKQSANKIPVGKLPSGEIPEENDGADIKGFDNFFMY